jgi:hypothetical protein
MALNYGAGQNFWGSEMFCPLNCRGGCYFFLDKKVTKKSSQQKSFFAARAFTLLINQNHGCNTLPDCRSHIAGASAKFAMPFPLPRATIVLVDFARSWSADGVDTLCTHWTVAGIVQDGIPDQWCISVAFLISNETICTRL